MKHLICILAIAIAYLGNAQAQWVDYDNLKLISKPVNVKNRSFKIDDTLKKRIPRMNGDTYLYTDRIDKDGNLHIKLDVEDLKYDHKYAFADQIKAPINRQITFGVDWAIYYDERERAYVQDPHLIYYQGDTIYTVVWPAELGTFSPEGHRFFVEGADIERIESRTKYMYVATQFIAGVITIDVWCENLGFYYSQWQNCADGQFSYVLPIVENLTFDKNSFQQARNKALKIQKSLLYNDYDSVLNSKDWCREYVIEALADLKKQLKPNLDDAKKFSEMCVLVGCSYFITEIKIYMKNGEVRNFVHHADSRGVSP